LNKKSCIIRKLKKILLLEFKLKQVRNLFLKIPTTVREEQMVHNYKGRVTKFLKDVSFVTVLVLIR
jgi:hypothetical protein